MEGTEFALSNLSTCGLEQVATWGGHRRGCSTGQVGRDESHVDTPYRLLCYHAAETYELIESLVNCEQKSLVYQVRPRRRGICHTKNGAGQARNCCHRRVNPATLALEDLDP